MRIVVLIALLATCSVNASSQESSQTRSQEIAVSFSKTKSTTKEKNGVRTEKYKDVRGESVTKPNPADYTGVYEIKDLGFVINLQVAGDGRVNGYGVEKHSRRFRLENARIEGPLLTANRIFDDGAVEKFEGVFMTRTVRTSPTASGVTTFGLGVLLNTPIEMNGITYEKLFFELKQ